jgi:DNA-binding NarL/FixJ family response regulator
MTMTVLIVDDHASFRAAARQLLELEGFRVVGEARDGESALAAARALNPALVLLDVQMPGANGFEVAAQLRREPDPPAVVLTSSRDGAEFELLVRASGARGFIPKTDLSGPAIRTVLGCASS